AEYPILLVLAALCRPREDARWPKLAPWTWLLIAALAVVAIAPASIGGTLSTLFEDDRVYVASAVAAVAVLLAVGLKASRWAIAVVVA
ncbi:UNVERIFIED_CONTAM: hypothetical protein NY100_24660, partial [Prevotella sp. 15_C9]